MDRNALDTLQLLQPNVALHRSAWIEILLHLTLLLLFIVALHRSAWIEIGATFV